MKFRTLGATDLQLSWLSFGASSLGQEFRPVDLNEALRSVHVALDLGMNFIDTSPFYGRGMSECLLGVALRGIPRDRYFLGTKLGRYDRDHFDFSARRVVESVDVSLHRMGVDYLDIILCHDIEFVDMAQIVEETLPALRKIQQQGKVRFVGISGYPMNIFRYVLDRTDLDVVLSYNHYTLQNTMLADLVPYLQAKNVGIMNAAPFSARLLTNAPLPALAQGHARGPGRRSASRRTLRGPRRRHRPAGGAILAGQRIAGHLRRRLGQSGQRAQVGRWADMPTRSATAGRSARNPAADSQLVLLRRPARRTTIPSPQASGTDRPTGGCAASPISPRHSL